MIDINSNNNIRFWKSQINFTVDIRPAQIIISADPFSLAWQNARHLHETA